MTQTTTKERGLICTAEQVRAILNGATQLRRVVKGITHSACNSITAIDGLPNCWYVDQNLPAECFDVSCPYGVPGDRLYVKEAWQICRRDRLARGEEQYVRTWRGNSKQLVVVYRASAVEINPDHPEWGKSRWKSSTTMHRHISRITLEVKRVWVERVQKISIDDCRAEGCSGGHESIPEYDFSATPREHFKWLWDSINASKGYGWDANPWVWCVEFERVEGER